MNETEQIPAKTKAHGQKSADRGYQLAATKPENAKGSVPIGRSP